MIMYEPEILTTKDNYAKDRRVNYGLSTKARLEGIRNPLGKGLRASLSSANGRSGILFVGQNLRDRGAQVIEEKWLADHMIHTFQRVA
jgi:hypothetical protein